MAAIIHLARALRDSESTNPMLGFGIRVNWVTGSLCAVGASMNACIALLMLTCGSAVANVATSEAERLAELTRPQSNIEIGIGAISDASFAAGNYTGLERKGAYAIGAFDWRGDQTSYGNAADDKTRWRIFGANLGLNARSLAGEFGRQGAYRITFGYDEIPRRDSDGYQTIFLGAGSMSLTLPAGFVRGADTRAMSTLDASLRQFAIESNRKRSEIGVSYAITREWELRAGWRNDDRQGTHIRSIEFGNSPGNPRAMLLPEPIDSSTQLVDASLAYTGEGLRASIAYHGSVFRNHVGALVWQNPFTSAPWVGPGTPLPVNFPLPMGQAGEAPDNQFHQLSITGNYQFSSSTRLTIVGSRGRMSQNEILLPYTINPGLAVIAPPQSGLDGVVDTTFLNAKLTLRPLRNLNVYASLRYEDRDNKTPQSEVVYIGGDVQLQPPPNAPTDRVRTNLPRSRRQTQLTLDADYRLAPGIAMKAGWEHDDVTRTFAEVEHANENTLRIEFRRGGTGEWTTSAGIAHLARRSSPYLYNLPFLASYTSSAFIASLAAAGGCAVAIDCIRAGPMQRKFYMADRDRDRLRLFASYTPDRALSLQARLDANLDRYPRTTYGVTHSRSLSANLEAGYTFNASTSATVFVSHEHQRLQERGRQILNPVSAGNADADWWNQLIDKTSSFGAGLRQQGLIGGKLELAVDAIAVRGRMPITTTVGTGVTAAQNPATALPDVVARSDNVNVSARYAIDRHSTLRARYFFQRLDNADWAYSQVGAATLVNVIGSREIPAQTSRHGVGISWVRIFR